MLKKIFLYCSFLLPLFVVAQTGSLKGKLVDSVGKQSLKDASITVLSASDSSLEVFGLSKEDGTFEIKNISQGKYVVAITFQGYERIKKELSVTKDRLMTDFGTIYLRIKANQLEEVTVEQSPIVMKKDTMEFNASSFKTKPNAVAEDLLKKLPGMDVDKSGNVKAQGESVQRILVDGKRFFGDDPKLATKNLPPDVIDKVQVFDDLSDQSKFTGFDDGNRIKTINFVTKKDKRKGYFGKAVAGVATDNHYDANFNVHKFNNTQQISVLGQANNLNKQNFNGQDIGGGRGGGGGSGGITTTLAGGLNYRDTWGKNTEFSSSYFFNKNSADRVSQSNTQNIIKADSSNFQKAISTATSNTQNHRFNFNIESKLDSMNSIVFRPNIVIQQSTPFSENNSVKTIGTDSINSSISKNSSTNNGFNINGANFQFRHRFKKPMRTMSIDLGASYSQNNGNGHNYSTNRYFTNGKFDSSKVLNQYYLDSTHSFTFNPTISYTEPIAKGQILELRYNYSNTSSTNVVSTYNMNSASQKYDQFDSLFSNSYKYNNISNRVTLSYRIQKEKFNFNIGAGVQFTDQQSVNSTKSITINRSFVNFNPSANFRYNYSKTTNLRIFYNGSTGQPGVNQLQPIWSTNNKINYQLGNANLRPQFSHNFRFLYHTFDVSTQRLFLITINASAIVNDIQNVVINYAAGKSISSYENLNGTYNVSGYVNYGFALKNPKSNINFTSNVNYGQSQTLVGNSSKTLDSLLAKNAPYQSIKDINTWQHNYTRNTSLSETVKWTTNLKENFDVNLSATGTYNIARNTINPSQNLNYFSQTYSVEFTYYTNSGWAASTDFDYTRNGNLSAGYNASIPLVTAYVAKQFLKNKAAELRLTVFDLFNQNTSVSRTVTSNTIRDSRSNVLTRYALLSFTYNLRQFPGQKKRSQNNMRGLMPPGGDGEGGGFRNGGGGFGGGRNGGGGGRD